MPAQTQWPKEFKTRLVRLRKELRCECGGLLDLDKKNCLAYLDTQEYLDSITHELDRRKAGAPFRASLAVADSVMSAHRQAHGFPLMEAMKIGL